MHIAASSIFKDIDMPHFAKHVKGTDENKNDPNSLFLQEAAKRGAETVNGLGILANQGALNFKLWTGQDAPVDVMTETLRREFGI